MKFIYPHQCILAYTLPLKKEHFLEDLQCSSHKDFAKFLQLQNRGLNKNALWSIRMNGPIKLAKNIMSQVRDLGVIVNEKVTGEEFANLFNEDQVITLVAHSTGSKVEFFDKLYSNIDIASQIPEHFNGIIDLTICNAFGLVDAIKAINSKCRIASNKRHTTFSLRMSLYYQIIRRLNEEKCDYLEALEKTRIEALKEEY